MALVLDFLKYLCYNFCIISMVSCAFELAFDWLIVVMHKNRYLWMNQKSPVHDKLV